MLCQFSHSFPEFVSQFLDSSKNLRRRFREETVTDILMSNLLMFGDGRVIVEFPDEVATGADMEWNFVNPDDQTFFRILLQAKRAYGTEQDWVKHEYKHLFYKTKGSLRLQVETLCDTALAQGASTYPLYIFYNPFLTCDLAQQNRAPITGVGLCDGFLIERLTQFGTTPARRSTVKKVSNIAPHQFDLATIFCPSRIRRLDPFAYSGRFTLRVVLDFVSGRIGRSIPPAPSEVCERLISTFREKYPGVRRRTPEVAQSIPDDVRASMERARTREGKRETPLTRYRVIFISASVKDYPRAD
jgi:hypothetical protein